LFEKYVKNRNTSKNTYPDLLCWKLEIIAKCVKSIIIKANNTHTYVRSNMDEIT
jgi:hypothetical protein